MIGIADVFVAVNDELRSIFPTAKIHEERINKLNPPALSVELISYRTPQHSKNIINKRIDLDIIYFAKEGKVSEALMACDELMSAFSLGIFVRKEKDGEILDKRFIHCLSTPEYKLVDDDLHFLVTFEFADELSHTYLGDDKTRFDFGDDTRGTYEKTDSLRPNDDKDFVKDVDFESEDDKKAYIDEGLKMMEVLKIEYDL